MRRMRDSKPPHGNGDALLGNRGAVTRVGLLVLAGLMVTLLAGCFGGGSKERKSALTTATETDHFQSEHGPAHPSSPRENVASNAQPRFGESKSPRAGQALGAEAAPDLAGRPTDDETWDHLKKKAEDDGIVPVIVALKATARPEGALSADERTAQRRDIARKRASVVQDLQGKGYRKLKAYDEVPFVAMHVSPEALEALRKSPDVIGVSEDRAVPLDDTTPTNSDPPLADWWDLSRAQIRTAWNNGYNGAGWTVAILDTGVDKNHPWLSGKVVSEACYATWVAGATAGYCPNGQWTQTGSGSARPCSLNWTSAQDCDHGTHVAQTAAGLNSGVAWRANIIAVQVFHRESDGSTRSSTSDQAWALKYVYDLRNSYNIAAVNLSIGGGGYTSYCDNIDQNNSLFYSWVETLRSVGIATVISAGNDNYRNALSSPGCISNVVSVGNSNLTTSGADSVWGNASCLNGPCGSNSASFLSLLAPGTRILSAVPNNGWGYKTGTSMAAPHVTGAFAVLKQLRWWASVPSMLTALQATGTPIYDGRNGYTKRRINVWDALVYLYNH